MQHVYRISSKNQVTLPKHIQECLGVREGDYITYHVENGRVYVTKAGLIPFHELRKLRNEGQSE